MNFGNRGTAMLPGTTEARISRTSHGRAVMANIYDDVMKPSGTTPAGQSQQATPRAADPR